MASVPPVTGAAGVEVGQERFAPLAQGPGPAARPRGSGRCERVQICSAIRRPVAQVTLVVHRAQLLGCLPGQKHLQVALVGSPGIGSGCSPSRGFSTPDEKNDGRYIRPYAERGPGGWGRGVVAGVISRQRPELYGGVRRGGYPALWERGPSDRGGEGSRGRLRLGP